MMIVNYPSKKELKACIGQPLQYTETSFFGPEYKANGEFSVSNRPTIPGHGSNRGKREFFARVTMKDGKIFKVE